MRSFVLANAVLGMAAMGIADAARADVALALRGGTLGIGAELAVGITDNLNLRFGYALFDYSTEIEDTDVLYDADLELRNPSALLDWHAFGGGFRVSVGAVGASTKVVGTGVPTGGSYEINGALYPANAVGSLKAEIEASNSIAPYIGIGWGNPVDRAGRWTFLFDIGAVYYGSEPDVMVSVSCGEALNAAQCAQLRNDVEAERRDLIDEVDTLNWYPVINLGISFRF